MTKYFMFTLLVFLYQSKCTLAQVPASAKAELITKINDTTIRVMPNSVVPQNHVFYVYDKKNLIATYRGGQRVLTNMVRDCVQYKCPRSFGRKIRCWRCF